MKFGMFLELQYPKPWLPGGELKLFQDNLAQVELADQLGFEFAWAVEHHFLEEYAHSSCPEVFLAAAARGTKRIRLGHGIVQTPPGYNQPGRVAERIATLDLVSGGRVEFGVGESSSRAELEGYGVPLEQKRDMFLEASEQIANMLALDPYPGFDGKYFSMPCRNFVPKAVQKPHPPMWMACSNRDQVRLAAELGLGCLTFSLVPPDQAKPMIEEYYAIFKSRCRPIAHSVNPNVCVVSQLSLDHDDATARARGLDAFLFFQMAVAHHYVFGVHKPGRVNLWEQYEAVKHLLEPTLPPGGGATAIGTPDHAREVMHEWVDAGADQVCFIAQGGKAKHEHILQSLELFATHVMPEFAQGEEEREAKKLKELGPYIDAAMERKVWMQPLADEDIPRYSAYRRPVAHGHQATGAEVAEDNWQVAIRMLMESVGLAPEHEE